MSKRRREKKCENGIYTDKIIFCERLSNLLEIRKKENPYFKQAPFAEMIGIDTSTLTKYLSPTSPNMPELDILMSMCNYLQCDVDYLIGKNNYITNDIKRCCEVTGLDEKSVTKLIYLQKKSIAPMQYNRKQYAENIETLNELITSEEFEKLLDTITNIKNTNINADSYSLEYSGVKEIELLVFMATHTLTTFIDKLTSAKKKKNIVKEGDYTNEEYIDHDE